MSLEEEALPSQDRLTGKTIAEFAANLAKEDKKAAETPAGRLAGPMLQWSRRVSRPSREKIASRDSFLPYETEIQITTLMWLSTQWMQTA
jgi:hypothetical protein